MMNDVLFCKNVYYYQDCIQKDIFCEGMYIGRNMLLS